jgi:hypothetical protein
MRHVTVLNLTLYWMGCDLHGYLNRAVSLSSLECNVRQCVMCVCVCVCVWGGEFSGDKREKTPVIILS